MSTSAPPPLLSAFREHAASMGWTITSELAIPSGWMLRLTDGAAAATVSLYSTGRAVVQGKAGPLREALEAWWSVNAKPPRTAKTAADPGLTGKPRIGIDESGKGDYFGPLVIAAVYVDSESERELLEWGAQDSKRLADAAATAIAAKIRARCPHSVVAIGPERYNALYERMRSVNRLLSWGHARALEDVIEKTGCTLALSDQFGDESYIRNALLRQTKARQITLMQQHRAEADTAVAAASILARAEFLRRLEEISRQLGKKLPKGASDPAILRVGRELADSGGESLLRKAAKLHFRTTQSILG